jgi:hypothetical protein
MPLVVMRGREEGPIIFLSSAIHGDEVNGIEIIREVLEELKTKKIRGTIIAAPIVNVFGFNDKSRYLPDRRDLNRSFPGNANGSLASRIAHIFMKEVVARCTHGIDYHTGAIHRSNYPQIRGCMDDENTKEMALAFNPPIIIDSRLRDGSLREAARKKKVCTLLFEGGQALRFEKDVIKVAKKGTLNVLKHIGILSGKKIKSRKNIIALGSYWVRSVKGGTLRLQVAEGDYIQEGTVLGIIHDPLAMNASLIHAEGPGYIIGLNHLPLVTIGDAIIHIAVVDSKIKDQKRSRDDLFFD